MRMVFGYGNRLGIIIDTRSGVRTGLDILLDMSAFLTGIKQVEGALYVGIQEELFVFLDVGKMNDDIHVFDKLFSQ